MSEHDPLLVEYSTWHHFCNIILGKNNDDKTNV